MFALDGVWKTAARDELGSSSEHRGHKQFMITIYAPLLLLEINNLETT
jgi:hypothetical protein